MLDPHMAIARAAIIFFLFQMAILMASLSFAKAMPEEYVHAKHHQQRRGREGQVSEDLAGR